MDFLSVRHQNSIGDPETETARLSIMRLVHFHFSKAEGCNFIDVFLKIKEEKATTLISKQEKVGTNVKYSLLRMTKTKGECVSSALSRHDRHYALCLNDFTPGKIAVKDKILA